MHRLRRHEEGQTLILAALFGLILALCVLGTVNLGRAVYDKMAVQTACDNGAYSQAAVEARVLNFTAYTNRAMVVHYASIMAASAYLTWTHYLYALIHGLLTLIKLIPIPPISAIANVVDQIFRAVMILIDTGVALLTPLLSVANFLLYALEEGAWLSILNRLRTIPREAHSGDSNSDPFQPLWPTIIPLANTAVFNQTRGSANPFTNIAQTASVLLNAKSDVVQEARLHMVEIANSSRTPWVVNGGDRYGRQSPSPLARHFGFSIGKFKLGAVARTELGTFEPKGFAGIPHLFGQVFSGDLAQITFKFPFVGSCKIPLFGLSTLDDLWPANKNMSHYIGFKVSCSGLIGKLIGLLLGAVLGSLKGLATWAQNNAKVQPNYRLFLISPYVYFAPRAAATPGGGLKPLGNFAQPDVLLGLAREGRDFNREPGAQKYFGGVHKVTMGGAGSGTVDFRYDSTPALRIPGLPGNLQLRRGFNALCAAQVYYHRPGDWREMPNFFNPLWAARLMPVIESNAINTLPGSQAIMNGLRPFLLH